ncbi:MAG: NAD(P)-dependent oxidoreductase [Clostridiales bacterium]|nr:NAD(P)-dependent oxidoreductase [Clostridiales bacterium]
MNIFMIGGTGLLGSAAAQIFIDKGHKVKTLSLPPIPVGSNLPNEMEIILKDANKLSDAEMLEIMKGSDIFVFATGVDERIEFSAPVYDAYYKYNIAPLERLLPLAKKAGMKGAVVCGSYFAWLAKNRPDMKLCDKHPYIKSRVEQENVCEKYSDKNFQVGVLELPYIFGTQAGRKPVWVILIEQLQRFEKMPFTMYPAGGTAMLTVRQVGQAIVGAAEQAMEAVKNNNGTFRAYGISCYNMTWREFLKIVYRAMNGTPNRKIVDVPKSAFKAFGLVMRKDYKERNVDAGIDPVGLADIMGMNLFIPTDDCKELGCTNDDIEKAIFDSIKLSKEAFEGKADLVEMKGE